MSELVFPITVTTARVDETEDFGARLARLLLADPSLPRYIALAGDLGVGKTAFVRGFASVVSPGAAVRSPTFALVNEYRVPKMPPVFHFDMYRITSEDDLYSIGYDDYLDRARVVDRVTLKTKVKDDLSKYIYTKTKRRPMVLPIIMNV